MFAEPVGTETEFPVYSRHRPVAGGFPEPLLLPSALLLLEYVIVEQIVLWLRVRLLYEWSLERFLQGG